MRSVRYIDFAEKPQDGASAAAVAAAAAASSTTAEATPQ
jgi:hypothetical protein